MADTTTTAVETLAKMVAKIDEQGGRLSVMAEPKGQSHAVHGQALERWTVGVEWGEEEPGSAMYAGASYGVQETLEDALAQAAEGMSL